MNSNIASLLERYLKRQTSTGEDQFIEKWLEENRIADPAWHGMNQLDKDKWLSDVFTEIKISIHEKEHKHSLKSKLKTNYMK